MSRTKPRSKFIRGPFRAPRVIPWRRWTLASEEELKELGYPVNPVKKSFQAPDSYEDVHIAKPESKK